GTVPGASAVANSNIAAGASAGQLQFTAAGIAATPDYNSGSGTHALAPADAALIYNAAPLYAQSPAINGSSSTVIAVIARTNITLSDVTTFRSLFGLGGTAPTVVVNGTDPGDLGGNEEAEAVLDLSWSGALAPQAQSELIVSKTTSTTDGII